MFPLRGSNVGYFGYVSVRVKRYAIAPYRLERCGDVATWRLGDPRRKVRVAPAGS